MSYIRLAYHLVSGTKERREFLTPDVMSQLREYTGGIVRNLGGELLAADGADDHMHVACVLNQKAAIMDVLQAIKQDTSRRIHDTFRPLDGFDWQDGYSAFTVSHSQLPRVITYIKNQREHHKKISFRDELIALLKRHGIAYDARYL